MVSINTNISSLLAQNNTRQVNNELEKAMERLSSGLRINSAGDDASGQDTSCVQMAFPSSAPSPSEDTDMTWLLQSGGVKIQPSAFFFLLGWVACLLQKCTGIQ